MNSKNLDELKFELSLNAKSGIDFIISACITWFVIAYLWTLPYSSYNKSVLTFIIGSLMIPLALIMSKILKTNWKTKNNPLQPLGLWLNFAQLFYFPFLVFILIKQPDYFIMTYAIITGAHLFPYAWFYDKKSYAIAAGVIPVGALLIALGVPTEKMYFVPFYTGSILFFLALFLSHKRKLGEIKK